MTDLVFTNWRRSPIYSLVTDPTLHDGRMVGSLELKLIDARGPDDAIGAIPFHLIAPRDIASLSQQAVLRTAPPAETRDAETTKLVHVDFAAADFPWRYTPRQPVAGRLPPWLVVLVGSVEELRVDGNSVAVLQRSVLEAHNLADSPRWAHVQDDGRPPTSRLLSPRALAAQTEYRAVLVPAFGSDGQPSWNLDDGRVPATLPALSWWRFWTSEAGDFETLAFQIMPRSAAGLGVAPLAYRRGGVDVRLSVRGAITALGGDHDGEAEAIARADLATFVDEVSALSDPLGRSVIGLPDYGRPWVADTATATWTATLNADPRFRGTAGLGLWMGIEAQDELVDAAARQLGGLSLAAHLVRQLALGLFAAGSLWERRLPDDPARRLDLFSPLMRRLRTATGTALGAVTGPEQPLEAALFSSAARRMLRRGAAWTRHSASGFVSRRDLIHATNVCPDTAPRPQGLPHVDAIAAGIDLPPLADLPHGIVRDPPLLDPDHRLDIDRFWLFLRPLLPHGRRPCSPVDIKHAVAVVAGAIDPRQPDPPAVIRIRSRIKGIALTTLDPPELPVGLDFPTWTLLRDRAKEWIVPGIGTLKKDSVVAMQTNPTFIDAYLVGLNTQLHNEMHWRNLAVDRMATPLLMFWGHINFESGHREAEIQPLASWGLATDLGDLSHQVLQPGDTTGKRDLVIVFRTDLFRRYPRTLVYLVRPTPTVDAALQATPDFSYAAANKPIRRFIGPIFQGSLEPDLVFFSFDIDPSALDQHWLVLDEPPSELRFRSVDAAGNPLGSGAAAAAAFAVATIDKPTRVGIDGAYLKSLGLQL